MELEAVGIAVNEVWIVLAAVLVMFMQAGVCSHRGGFHQGEERREHHYEERHGLLGGQHRLLGIRFCARLRRFNTRRIRGAWELLLQ